MSSSSPLINSQLVQNWGNWCMPFTVTCSSYKHMHMYLKGVFFFSLFSLQLYLGRLSNGAPVTIRSLNVKRRQTSQSLNRHIETISRLRHRHLVSSLGHCFEYDLDDSTVTQLYLVFEYVQNGNLRSRISRMLSVLLSFISLTLTIQSLTVMLLSELFFTRRNWRTEAYLGAENISCHRSRKWHSVLAWRDDTWSIWKQPENQQHSSRPESCR